MDGGVWASAALGGAAGSAGNVSVRAQGKTVICGWDHLLAALRKKLSVPKRC